MNLSKAQHRTFAITWLTYAGFYFCRKNLSIALLLLVVLASGHCGWNQLFFIFAATALSAGLLLLPLWNLSPAHTKSKRAHSTGFSDLPGECVSEIAN